MGTNRWKPFLMAGQSIGLALLTFFVTYLWLGLIGEKVGEIIKFYYPDIWLTQLHDIFVYTFYILIISFACFYIVRRVPKSIWFVPFICNGLSIIIAIAQPTSFWKESHGIILCFGWVLSITASIIGTRIGKRNAVSDNQ